MAINPDPEDLRSIPPEDRKRLEEMGEAYVRRVRLEDFLTHLTFQLLGG